MDRTVMTHAAETVIARQDGGDVEGILELFAEDCTFMMPVLSNPIQGRGELREYVVKWPKAITNTEWVAIDGNRLVCAWNWRGDAGLTTHHCCVGCQRSSSTRTA